jgi:hypothetical protein
MPLGSAIIPEVTLPRRQKVMPYPDDKRTFIEHSHI